MRIGYLDAISSHTDIIALPIFTSFYNSYVIYSNYFITFESISTLLHISSFLDDGIQFYRPPTKLWEGNVFSHVCLSVCLFTGDRENRKYCTAINLLRYILCKFAIDFIFTK